VVLAAPELVLTQPIELFDQVDVALELQGGVLTDRVVRRKEGAKFHAAHRGVSRVSSRKYSKK
jgi:hypothetical protein